MEDPMQLSLYTCWCSDSSTATEWVSLPSVLGFNSFSPASFMTNHVEIPVKTTDENSMPSNEEEENSENESPKLRRNRSVQFADALGKPLVEVCTYDLVDEPVVADDFSVMALALSRVMHLASPTSQLAMEVDCMEQLFPDPLANYSALSKKVRTQNIALESVCCRGGSIKGLVRVRNFSDKKHVFARVTFDGWASHHDWTADVFPFITSSEKRIDYCLYEFLIPIPPYLMAGTVVEFAICYIDQLGEFWDNNEGLNYSLRYHPLNNAYQSTKIPQQPKTNINASCDEQTLNALELDAERARRIRDFVMSEFAWNSGSVPSSRTSDVKSSTKNRAAPTQQTPYW